MRSTASTPDSIRSSSGRSGLRSANPSSIRCERVTSPTCAATSKRAPMNRTSVADYPFMDIIKQIYAADIGIDDERFVVFVEAETIELPGPEPGDSPYPLDRYVASIHRRPVGQASFIESCRHQHRQTD